ncbi:MAG: hypothetical protein WC781_03555 [Candidatus Pacearchaeota archaeon]|jgi:hypothetical protein
MTTETEQKYEVGKVYTFGKTGLPIVCLDINSDGEMLRFLAPSSGIRSDLATRNLECKEFHEFSLTWDKRGYIACQYPNSNSQSYPNYFKYHEFCEMVKGLAK